MSDSEYEEETSYVLFDVGTAATTDYIDQASMATGGCRITGLEEGQPFLQIGDMIFEGEVDETLGTHMIFEIEERKIETTGLLPLLSSIRADNEEATSKQPKYTLKYACQTENIIKMDTVTLEPKREEKPAIKVNDDENEDETTTIDALL